MSAVEGVNERPLIWRSGGSTKKAKAVIAAAEVIPKKTLPAPGLRRRDLKAFLPRDTPLRSRNGDTMAAFPLVAEFIGSGSGSRALEKSNPRVNYPAEVLVVLAGVESRDPAPLGGLAITTPSFPGTLLDKSILPWQIKPTDTRSLMISAKNTAVGALALAGLVALPSIAAAAYALRAVNERAGPGTGYAVIATIPAGSYVAVHSCPTSWCQVTWRGITGWVSAKYVGEGGGAYAPQAYPPSVVVVQPEIGYGYGLEYGWSFDRFDDRDFYRHRHVYPGHRPPPRPRPPDVGAVGGGVPPHLRRPGTNYATGQFDRGPAIRAGRPCLLKQRCS